MILFYRSTFFILISLILSSCVTASNSGKNVFVVQEDFKSKDEITGGGCEGAFASYPSLTENLIQTHISHNYGSATLDLYEKQNLLVADLYGIGILNFTTTIGLIGNSLRVYIDVENTDNYKCSVYFEVMEPLDKNSSSYTSFLEKYTLKPDQKTIVKNVSLHVAMQMCSQSGLKQSSKYFGKCVLSKI